MLRWRLPVGVTVVTVAVMGCASQNSTQQHLQFELERLRAEAQDARMRATEMELRMVRLEQTAATATATNAAVIDRLDHLIELNTRLVVQTEEAPPRELSSAESPEVESDLARYQAQSASEKLLLQLFERMRTDRPPWAGGLSREQREALRVLLRRDRTLDSRNPWLSEIRP